MAEQDEVSICVSAPGKVILHGEHSVVYGKHAVALSLGLRTSIILTPGGTDLVLEFADVSVHAKWSMFEMKSLWSYVGHSAVGEDSQPLTAEEVNQMKHFLAIEDMTELRSLALVSFFNLYIALLSQPQPMHIIVRSELPTGAGVGSSAAYGVCLSAALLGFAKLVDLDAISDQSKVDAGSATPQPLQLICRWAYVCEQVVHGTPSGIDNSVCTYGGAVSFHQGTMRPASVPSIHVLLVNTKVPRSTRTLVTGVRERKDHLPNVIEPILEAMDAVAIEGLKALNDLASAGLDSGLRSQAYQMLNELFDVNHALLCSLGVSHVRLEKIVSITKAHGLHAKLTGAGGGGFALALLPEDFPEESVGACIRELEQDGFQVWRTVLGAPGVSVHHSA